MLAPQRQRAEVPDGDAHARGLLLDEGARAGGADLVHLEVGDLAALRGDILRVLPADFKDGVGLGHPDACGPGLRGDLVADDARVAGDAAGEDNGLMDGETAHDRRLIVADHRVAQAEQDVLLGDALLLAVDDVGLGEHGAASVSARPDARRASCGAARRPRAAPACRPEKEVKKPWFLAHLW